MCMCTLSVYVYVCVYYMHILQHPPDVCGKGDPDVWDKNEQLCKLTGEAWAQFLLAWDVVKLLYCIKGNN